MIHDGSPNATSSQATSAKRTLYDKIWARHLVTPETTDKPAALFIDLHLVHEVTSPQAFETLRQRGLPVRRPDLTHATMDHSTPTLPPKGGVYPFVDAMAAAQVRRLRENCQHFGVPLYPLGSAQQGIVHVIGPELGLTQPGRTVVCGDSHTATHGAFGCLAFGIGTSEVTQVLATQCLLQRKTRTMAIEFEGKLPAGLGAKDMILALIAAIGTAGGTGYTFEYRGQAIRDLDMEGRMTLCNMTIEAGARAGLIAPDQVTFDYLAGRAFAPADWEAALADWRTLHSDEGAVFDHIVRLDVSRLEPMITYGTDPGMGMPISAIIPEPANETDRQALAYMGFHPGQRMLGKPVDAVFIGSCTNARIGDMREAARILAGRKVAPGVRTLIVPGSRAVKEQAEAEGLDRIFREAGAEWREPGCSMCIAMNGDMLAPGELAVSTSNRNFEGRQGKGSRTLLASPATAAAAAVCGVVADARTLEVCHAAV